MRVRTMVAALILTCGSAVANAQQNEIVAVAIDGLHQSDGNGLYDQIIATAAQNGADVSVKALPPNRAFALFESGKAPCITPANKNPAFYDFPFETVQSTPMFVAKVYIFTPDGTAPVSDLKALQGQKVGIRTGMPYGQDVEGAGLNFVDAPTIESNIKKLQAGRIDSFIAYYPDVYTAFDQLGMAPLPHAVDAPVATHEDSILCRTDMGGEGIVASFNKALDAMSADGSLAKLLGE
jgi:hypothetical protein